MKASQVVFQQLLDGSIQYRVPLFQRTYGWDQRQAKYLPNHEYIPGSL